MRVIGWLMGLLLLLAGCSDGFPLDGHACTEIGCADGAQLEIRAPDNSWPAGSYRLELTFDAVSHVCEVRLPRDLPASVGSTSPLACSSGLQVAFRPEVTCTEQRTRDAVSQSCTPIAGHWLLGGSVAGTPSSLHARLERDGLQLLDQTQTLRYEESRPNGADCEPVCRQSSVVLELP